MNVQAIECVLTLWQLGLLRDEVVMEWADAELLRAENPSQLLLDLSLDGPKTCLKRAEFEFPARPLPLSFAQQFALRAMVSPLHSDADWLEFAHWMSRHAMGLDPEQPEPALAYRVDHLLNDCDDAAAALALLRGALPGLLPRCQAFARPFVDGLPAMGSQQDVK